MRRRVGVAEDGLRTAGQDSRTPSAFPREQRMTDRVDTSMLAMEAANRQSIFDGALAETQRAQLVMRRDRVMVGRERRDPVFQVVCPLHMRG
jgi:hypothetical protein